MEEGSPLAGHLAPRDLITGVNGCPVTRSGDWLACLTQLPRTEQLSLTGTSANGLSADQLLDLVSQPASFVGVTFVLSVAFHLSLEECPANRTTLTVRFQLMHPVSS